MMACMEGKVAVITGAGGGIGTEIAKEFAKRKAKLVLVDIDEENLQNTVQICKSTENIEVLSVKADLASKEGIDLVVEKTITHFGNINFLVNNAGAAILGYLAKTSWEKYNKVMAINLRAPFFLTKRFLPSLKKTKGSIVNVGSINAVIPMARSSAYSVTKGGLNILTRAVAQEVAGHGIKVNGVNPGGTDTKMIGSPDDPNNKLRSTAKTYQPLSGLIKPQEIARWVVFLASEESGPITGQNIIVDGGRQVMSIPLEFAPRRSRL